MKSTPSPKVAFVTNYVPIYRHPIYELLQRSAEFQFKIFTSEPLSQSCREARAGLSLKYSASLTARGISKHRHSGGIQHESVPLPLGLLADLISYRPRVIVAGDLGIRSTVCWIAAKLIGAKLVLSSEEIASSARGRTGLQLRLRRFLIPRAEAFLAWGSPARRYLIELGAPASKIYSCAQAVDNEYWTTRVHSIDRSAARAALEFRGTVFLLAGRTVQLKGFQNFLQAWARVPHEARSRALAVIVGDGDYMTELRGIAAALRLSDVIFAGAKPAEALVQYYAAADVFVIPSLVDVWGLVVNEAMCAGLPILGSCFAGAAQAHLGGRDTGVLFDPTDVPEFSRRIHAWIDAPPPRTLDAWADILHEETFEVSSRAITDMFRILHGESESE